MGGHQTEKTEKTGRGTEQQVQSHSLRALVEQMPADGLLTVLTAVTTSAC